MDQLPPTGNGRAVHEKELECRHEARKGGWGACVG